MINAREALQIVLDATTPLGPVTASIERSTGSALAEDIIARENIPSFDNAAMDGFAVISSDAATAPVTLNIAGEVAAGAVASEDLKPGDAMAIMTGAKLPRGCDAVIPQEWTERPDPRHVKLLRPVSAGHNVRRAGSDLSSGTIALKRGTRLRPQEIGVLASLGRRFVVVHRKPSVSILATGSEIVDIEKPLPDGKVRNSNAYVLASLVAQLGCDAVHHGIVADEPGAIRKGMEEGLRSDVLITTGGVSVGKYDLVMSALKEIGGEVKFWKVNIKPGMPVMFALCKGRLVFGLPGNPVSAMVTFLQFVRPALLRLMGLEYQPPMRLHAKLDEEIRKSDGKRHFVRGILSSSDGSIRVRTTGSQVSNILTSLSRADCLIVLPEERDVFPKGGDVEVELL